MVSKRVIKDYYSLTKGNLVFGNIITVFAGFALGSHGSLNVYTFFATAIGIFFVMASGCVFNNYIDRDIDAQMDRTKDRVLVTGQISGRSAIIFGAVLGISGFLMLAVFTNLLTVAVAAFGFFFYVFMYSLWFKRRTAHGALVGSISGATPPVVGYVAASGRFDLAALILCLTMIVWQMPHFFAIAIRRADDYAAGKIPVMPISRGIRATKIQMLLYIIAFIIIAPMLTVFGYTGQIYFIIALALGILWLGWCLRGFFISDTAANQIWARHMFLFSLVVMMTTFVTIAIGAIAR